MKKFVLASLVFLVPASLALASQLRGYKYRYELHKGDRVTVASCNLSDSYCLGYHEGRCAAAQWCSRDPLYW